jgi:protein-tyrosine phosphatase
VSTPTRLLFVCRANLIRSPLAENLFRHLLSEAGLEGHYSCDSAGTAVYSPGSPPHPAIRQTADSHGIALTGRSRAFETDDFARFDHILAADRDVAADLRGWATTEDTLDKIQLLTEFDPLAGRSGDIPDPYGGGPGAFEQTYQAVERSVRGLLEWLEGRGPKPPPTQRREGSR